MRHRPTITILGAPGTGAEAMADALRERIPATAALILCNTTPPAPLPATASRFSAQVARVAQETTEATQKSATALSQHTTVILLMGLDLPCLAADRAAQEAADTRLRRAVEIARMSYKVVYGLGAARIQNACFAIKNIATTHDISKTSTAFNALNDQIRGHTRPWTCEKCSDPVCEHRLFTTLTGLRSSTTERPDLLAPTANLAD